jgi:hypothetical protein
MTLIIEAEDTFTTDRLKQLDIKTDKQEIKNINSLSVIIKQILLTGFDIKVTQQKDSFTLNVFSQNE